MPTRKSNRSTSRTTRGKWNYGNTTTTTRNTATARSYSPNQYNKVNKNIQQWIGSFRNIKTQFSGAGKVTAFSPSGVNKWIKYVNSGAFIYKWTNNDFFKKFGTHFNNPTTTPTNATRTLQKKYGTGIKAVTRGKGGCWLVAASPNVSGAPFNNYKW